MLKRLTRKASAAATRAPSSESLEGRVLLSLAPVLDVNSTPAPALGPVAVANGLAFFPHDDSLHGPELWTTDGTPAGTALLGDFLPGPDGSQPAVLGAVGDTVFFTTDDGSGDQQLWAADGTAGNTRALHSFDASAGSVGFSNPVGADGAAFFTAFRFGRKELWKTDGTPGGTAFVKALPPTGFLRVDPALLDGLVVAGTLYFCGYNDAGSLVLWKSDGTEAGTTPVQAQSNGPIHSPSNFLEFNGTLMFTQAEPGLWVTDGTTEGTRLAVDVGGAGVGGAVAVFDGRVFFGVYTYGPTPVAATGADAGAAGRDVGINSPVPQSRSELWCTDGTQAGTRRVAAPRPGGYDGFSAQLQVSGGSLYYTAEHNSELWRLDSADPGAQPVLIDTNSSQSPHYDDLEDVAGQLYFFDRNTSFGPHLFRTGPHSIEPVPLADPPPSDTFDDHPIDVAGVTGDRLFLDVPLERDPNVHPYDGRELWSVTNAQSNATRSAVLVGGTLSSEPAGLKALGDRVFFNANERTRGDTPDFWVSDGTAGGTRKLMNLGPIYGRGPAALGAAGGAMLFSVYAGNSGADELWRSDGTLAGTAPVHPAGLDGPIRLLSSSVATLDGEMYFSSNSGGGTALWKTDGTDAGTVLVKRPEPLRGIYPLVGASDKLFFFQPDEQRGELRLWTSDGTPQGTTLVKVISGHRVSDPYTAGDVVVFTVQGVGTSALWKSDGTDAGTGPVPAALVGTYGSAGGTLYLRNVSSGGRQQLWKTDGTEAGSLLLKEWEGVSTDPEYPYPTTAMMGAGGRLYFVASDRERGWELWSTDGTIAGTALVRDVAAGAASSLPRMLSGEGGVLVFSADDHVHGREVWRTDGSAEGTVLLADIQSGHEGSSPYEVAWAGPTLFVSATSRTYGRELWALRPEVTGRQVFYEGGARDAGGAAGDDASIAPDKRPLLPGGTASYANLTSYTRGLNGIMVDVRGPRGVDAGRLSAADFEFRAGTGGDPDVWPLAPAPSSVDVRKRAGPAGADRVTLTWADGAIVDRWLRVTVRPTANTALAAPDVFYFGNLVGKGAGAGGPLGAAGAAVNALDLAVVRRALGTAAGPGSAVDHNRDGRVNALDLAAARTRVGHALALVSAPGAPPPASPPSVASAILSSPSKDDRDLPA